MRIKVKPPSAIQSTTTTTTTSALPSSDEIKQNESLETHPAISENSLLNAAVQEEDEKNDEKSSSNINADEKTKTTTKKEPLKKRIFAKRGDAAAALKGQQEKNRSSPFSCCTPSSTTPFSSSSSTKTTSVSRLACKGPVAAAPAGDSDTHESGEAYKVKIPEDEETFSTNFNTSTDSNNNNNIDSKSNKSVTKSSQKSTPVVTETHTFSSSRYSVAGSQISLISTVMDRMEKGKHLDESLASNRRLPEPLDEKKIATYAGIIALCVLTIIILGIAAFMFLMT